VNLNDKIAVIGAGSWGTALAQMLSMKNSSVVLWGHRKSHIAELASTGYNSLYLPGIPLRSSIRLTDSLEDAVRNAGIICMVVPSHSLREVFSKALPYLEEAAVVVSAIKGIENSSLKTMTQVMEEILQSSDAPKKRIRTAVLSGPSFAREVALEIPTAVTIGCRDIECAKKLQKVFGTEKFRVYASRDVIGLEISAALKNIVALAAGICDGLGYGLNTRAALITRGLAEITRLGVRLGAEQATFSGLSGIGDLVLTCTGDLSRNRSVGIKLGQGKKLAEILEEMQMVAEGVKTTKSVYDLAKSLHIEMPILDQVYKILYENKDCSLAVVDLLARELKVE
jgi:glycerol-3-phosphate dehydrogenase (NAD(P)+)